MSQRFKLILLPLIWLSVPANSHSQTVSGKGISLDSTITLVNGMLNPAGFERAHFYIDSLLGAADAVTSDFELISKLKIKSLYGRYLLAIEDYRKWIPLYSWCMDVDTLCRSEIELTQIVRLFNNAGIAFKRLGLLNESREAFLKSTEDLRRMKNPDQVVSGSVYANAGNALKQIGEFERSIDYLEQSIRYFDEYAAKSTNPDPFARIAQLRSTALDNLGLVYQALTDHNKAIAYFRQNIDFRNKHLPGELNDVFNNLVISLIETGELKEAADVSAKILSDYGSGRELDLSWALASLNLADIRFRQSADSIRLVLDLENLDRTIRNRIPKAIDILTVANQLKANILMAAGRFPEALISWRQSLQSIGLYPLDSQVTDVPDDFETLKTNKLIELTNLNAKIFYAWGKAKSDPELLFQAEARYMKALKMIDSLRNSLELQSSKIQVSLMQRASYNELIELQYLIYQITGNGAYVPRVFETMEQSKSAALWSSVREVEFKSGIIPAKELDLEKAIGNRISGIQGRIIAAGSPESVEHAELPSLRQQLLRYNQQIDSLKQVFRKRYPDYFMAKFDRSTKSLGEICRLLKSDQVLIEYTIVAGTIYIILAGKDRAVLKTAAWSEQTLSDMAFITDFMKGHLESLTGQARSHYCQSASRLYDLLIQPFEAEIKEKSLIIIPDGALSYIPFEALLEKLPESTGQDFRLLPYLVRNHDVCYSLTANILFHQPNRVARSKRPILAIAPEYDFTVDGITEYVRKSKKDLPELVGTYQESRQIRKLLGGRLLTGRKASESSFKESGPSYQILHLAMHSIPDNRNSMNSCLVFTPGADGQEDGALFVHEVYNLNLNASLTVLSACETGSGQLAGGEGILSFGRAFMYAGCPNLVMTLWTVDDRSSKEIMIDFYKSLIAGSGVSGSLRSSKLNYLSKADPLHAHPHFWAGFIELGQDKVLQLSERKPGRLLLLLFVGCTIIVLALFHKKRNPRRSGDSMKR